MWKVLVLLFVLPATVNAASLRWKWIGPSAGQADVIPDPNHGNIWYANNEGQLYHSTDNAQSWIPTNFRAGSIFVHPLTSRLLLSNFERGKTIIRESRDFGRSFRRLAELPAVSGIAEDPTSELRLVSIRNTTPQSASVSSDGGRTWNDVSAALPIVEEGTFNGCRVYAAVYDGVVFSPLEPGVIYISIRSVLLEPCNSRSSQLLVSRDFGKSWKIEGNFDEDGIFFIKDPYFPSRVFAIEPNHRTYIFTESGLRFHSERSVGNFTSFPANPNHLLDIYNGVFESFDGGVTWRKIRRSLPPVTYQIVAMRNPRDGLLAVTGGGGLYKGKFGSGWITTNTGFKSARITSMDANGTNVYTILHANFVYHTSNSGKTWTDLSFHVPQGFEFQEIAVNPFDPSNVILIGRRSRSTFFLVTFDYGRNWRIAFPADFGSRVQFHPLVPNVVYFHRADGIYKSRQKGLNPKKLSIKDINPYKISFDLTDPNQLFFVTCSQIYKSIDEGKTIERIGTEIELDETCFTDVAKFPEEYYLTADGWSIFYRSLGVERKWKNISHLPPQTGGGGDPKGAWRFFPADINGDHIFALSAVLYETFDRGFHWKRVKPEVEGIGPIGAIHDMSDPRTGPIYLATDQGILMQQ
jgi:photosystem II stability/assembly factor-like uncharacterized protein